MLLPRRINTTAKIIKIAKHTIIAIRVLFECLVLAGISGFDSMAGGESETGGGGGVIGAAAGLGLVEVGFCGAWGVSG